MAEPVLRQILTSLVGTVRRIRVAVVESDGTEITLATAAKQDTLIAKDFATESTLSAQLDIELSVLRDALLAGPVNTVDSRSLRGLAVEKPAAAAGNKNKTYWSIDTGTVEVSDGTVWIEV